MSESAVQKSGMIVEADIFNVRLASVALAFALSTALDSIVEAKPKMDKPSSCRPPHIS